MAAIASLTHEIEISKQSPYIGLDEEQEWTKFSNLTSNDQMWESHVVVEGMHCAACAFNVEKALKSVAGVQKAEVNAVSKRASITWSQTLTKPSDWLEALSKAGYSAMPANEIFNLTVRKKAQRLMLWRLLVAGFCMMQVMMYAYPAYIAHAGEMTEDIKVLLRWASWIISLPVILFSSAPFFANAYQDVKNQQISMDLPVALGICITFVVSTAATFQPNGWWGHEVYFDSMTMFVFFLLAGRWLELKMRDKTAGALDILMRRMPSSVVRILQNGVTERIALARLNVGDTVQVLPGEAFPADGKVVLGETSADESLLTGESTPVIKAMGAEVIAGSHNLTAVVNVKIHQLGESTRYAQIVALMAQASTEKPRLALLADRIARPFLWFVLIAAISTAAFLWHTDHGKALMTAVAILIVTCPCALSLATPAAMLTSAGALAKKGVLVRKMQALEALTHIDTLVFDKTGTLTDANMNIGNIKTNATYTAKQALDIAAQLATFSLHPVSKALVNAVQNHDAHDADFEIHAVKEILGQGLTASSNIGRLFLGTHAFCNVRHEVEDSASSVYLASQHGWIATFEIVETVKPDTISAIDSLKRMGMTLVVLSGDKESTVQRFAEKVGISQAKGSCSPKDKLSFIQNIQNAGHQVAMVGDGLNDGPVLALAHVSIAMGRAVPLSQAQSDFIVMNNQITNIVTLITEAKRTMRIIKQNLTWALLYNLICIPLAIAGLLPAWLAGLGMALSSLLVVLNALRLSTVANVTRQI